MNKTNKAILKIAYAIAALDGAVSDSALTAFRKIAESLPDFDAGKKETNDMFLEAFALGDQIVALRKAYDEDELVTAVVELTKEDYNEVVDFVTHITYPSLFSPVIVETPTIQLPPLQFLGMLKQLGKKYPDNLSGMNAQIIRRAFMMWVAISLADGEMQKVAKIFLKQLQGKKKCVAECVTDEFLDEAEQTIKMMMNVQAKMKGASVAETAVLQKAYDKLEGSLKDMISGD